MNTLIEEKAKTILANGLSTVSAIGIFDSGEKRKLRIFKSAQGNYCYKASHKIRYGYPLNTLPLIDLLPAVTLNHKSESQIWYDSWFKVKQRLEKSKLWPEVLSDVNIALDVGYEKLNKAYTQYWIDNKDIPAKEKYAKNDELNAKKIKDIDERLTETIADGRLCANTSIIWYMHRPAKVKKMRFCKYGNEEVLQRIALAMQNKQQCFESGRTNYDIGFEYSPDKGNKAWYSEEFKGCGNGHYYLALDATHALFYEND